MGLLPESEQRSDVFVYLVDFLPSKVKGLTIPCPDGYTVYINQTLSDEAKLRAYYHELQHIDNNDYDQLDIGQIEGVAHKVV